MLKQGPKPPWRLLKLQDKSVLKGLIAKEKDIAYVLNLVVIIPSALFLKVCLRLVAK
jgi:hypothetical protein